HRLHHVVGDVEQGHIAVLAVVISLGEHQATEPVLIQLAAGVDVFDGMDGGDGPFHVRKGNRAFAYLGHRNAPSHQAPRAIRSRRAAADIGIYPASSSSKPQLYRGTSPNRPRATRATSAGAAVPGG